MPVTSGRPRDTTVEPRVRKAVLDVLASKGYAGLRIEDVVRTSGVAKTTIYRRWASLDALVLDAVDVALGDRTVPETGDVVADLVTLVTMLHRSLVDNPWGWALPAIGLSVARDPHLVSGLPGALRPATARPGSSADLPGNRRRQIRHATLARGDRRCRGRQLRLPPSDGR